jgi:PKD repeat protein
MTSPSGNVDFFATVSGVDSFAYPINYLWSFGDGSSITSAIPSVSHFYNSPIGAYTVCVIIQTADSCSSTFCDSVVFNSVNPCQAGFSFYLDSITVPPISPCVFIDQSIPGALDSVISWSWNFNDGATSTVQNPVHTFTFPGTYNVCLTINTIGGCSSTSCDSIIIPNNVPINCQANFYSVVDSISGQIYNFIDQSFPDSTNNIVNWSWHFAGGAPAVSSSQNPVNIIYNLPGIYTICLTITTSSGCTSTFCDTIITSNPCQLSATFNTQSPTTIGGNDGFIETFVIGGTPPYVYSWNTGQTTANIYNLTSGAYLLNLIDANNCSFTYTTQLYEPYDTTGGPVVDTLTTSIIDTCLGFVPDSFYIANVVIDSINNIATITWTFTNGGLTSSITAQYTYFYSGNNAVILTLNCGAKILTTYMSFINITASVGVTDNIEEKLEITVYPVPFNDRLNVVFNSVKSGIVEVNVIDVTGRSIVMKQIMVSSGENIIELNTSDFHSGIYILNIECDGKALHKQLIK